MAEAIKIQAEAKQKGGKGAARALRRAGKVPAIIYGGSHKEIMISLNSNELLSEYNRGNITSKLFEIVLGAKKINVIPKDIQVDPITDLPIHADFLEVSKDTKVKISLYVKVTNEDKAPGVKKGGVLNVASRYVPFYCHPNNIPEALIVDVGSLEIGQNIHINDLKLPQGVTPVDSSNFVLVSISGRATTTEEESTEGEVTNT